MLETEIYDGKRTELELFAKARSGDGRAFEELTLPLRRELHVHCYRMLGSLDDADDALQEALLRAWRGMGGFEPRAPFRAWLYRIATNVCLTALTKRARRGEVPFEGPEIGRGDAQQQGGEPVHLDPYPDRLLDEIAPDAAAERQENVELAFVAAVQLLPPRQRAALLLRDVVGYTVAEVAEMLATSVAGANSALQRARTTLARGQASGQVTRAHARSDSRAEQTLVRRLVDAWQTADVPSIVEILTEDALFTMPPQPTRYEGREEIGAFLATVPGGGRLDRFRLVPTRANRQPAVAAYLREGGGAYRAHAVIVLAIEGEGISSLVRFADPDLFERFGLPTTLDD
jgi:RNA polymerase sigma-70 factor, ECF subfamily